MIVRTQDLKGSALVYCLWLVEGGTQHKSSSSMWFFPRRKLSIMKNNWKPWENRGQAFDLLDDHNLCVWHDTDGWHAGSYGATDLLSSFVDAATPALAICLAAIAKYMGDQIDVPNELLEAA